MRELSLHITDIIENSLSAGATLVEVEVIEDTVADLLTMKVKDNGRGIEPELLKEIKDPFITTRSTRKVGLGISLFEAACLRCGGSLDIASQVGAGTVVSAAMKYNHIDRAPMGPMEECVVVALLNGNADVVYKHNVDGREFVFDSREIKAVVGEDLNSPSILQWIKEYISENIHEIGGGVWK
jgi:hypothetical protein